MDDRAARAASFQGAGAEYHRLRPGYPDVAVDWALPAGARDVLDLGAGSGRLTDSLVERGLVVTAADPSASMLAVLGERLPAVVRHEASAEALPLPDAAFDAVLVGQAWHWMDPAAASAEAARVLRPGGTLAMLWNDRVPQPGWQEEFDAIQDGARGSGLIDEEGADAWARPPFGPREVFTTSWSREVSPDDFLALYTTHSPFLVQDEQEQHRRLAAWRALLDAHAGATASEDYTTTAWRFALPA